MVFLLDGTEDGCKVGLWRVIEGLLTLSLIFTPLTLLSASLFSNALVLASNSLVETTTLPRDTDSVSCLLPSGGYGKQCPVLPYSY